jgi:hypothetical protein
MSTATPHYLAPLADLIRQSLERIKAGRVYEARTAHDNWCLIWRAGLAIIPD